MIATFLKLKFLSEIFVHTKKKKKKGRGKTEFNGMKTVSKAANLG
jgi:hypothetical protein